MPQNTVTHVVVGMRTELGTKNPAGLKLSSEAHEVSVRKLFRAIKSSNEVTSSRRMV